MVLTKNNFSTFWECSVWSYICYTKTVHDVTIFVKWGQLPAPPPDCRSHPGSCDEIYELLQISTNTTWSYSQTKFKSLAPTHVPWLFLLAAKLSAFCLGFRLNEFLPQNWIRGLDIFWSNSIPFCAAPNLWTYVPSVSNFCLELPNPTKCPHVFRHRASFILPKFNY